MPLPTVRVRLPWSPRDRGANTAERDAEAEIARNLWRHHKILPPTSLWRSVWDWCLLFLVVFSSVMIPFVLSFNLAPDVENGLDTFEVVIDAIFWADIVLIFNTSFYLDEELVSSRSIIVKHYAFTWFPVDLAATFPWEVLARIQGLSGLIWLRLLRLLRLSRVVKKIDQLKGGMALRFFYLVFWWMLIAHWTACFWWLIGKEGFISDMEKWHQGIVPNETNWLVRIPPVGKAETGFSNSAFEQCVLTCLANDANLSRVECMSSRQCDDNNFNPLEYEETPNHWLSSFYWAFTMLMKMPYVGPDTTGEKLFSCFIVIVGAIIFALVLGQVTSVIIAASKAGAQLRDLLLTFSNFASSRRVPLKMHSLLRNHVQAEWQVTKGMDTQQVLEQFPAQLRGDVLNSVFASLIECDPPFLRCSEQLRRQLLALLQPSVALKKQTVLAGRQYGGTMYVLMKGTLQVAPAPTEADPAKGRPGASPGMGRAHAKSIGRDEMRKQLTKMNTKGFKDKLKARMLERPGSVIPYSETVFEGPKASPFSVFAVTLCHMLTLEAPTLARLLALYPSDDASVVSDALSKEYCGLIESLKMNKSADSLSMRESRLSSSDNASPQLRARRGSVTASKLSLAANITKMEQRTKQLIDEVDSLHLQAAALPRVLQVLTSRLSELPQPAVPPSPDLSERPAASGGSPAAMQKNASPSSGLFGFGSS